jgi:membrane-associated phospholipid phosphatase
MEGGDFQYLEDIPIDKLSMENIADGLGFYGPLVIMGCVIVALVHRPKYMAAYVMFVFLNNVINRGLKMMIQEERPANPKPFSKYERYQNAEHYGMPSGHASSVAFSFVYLFVLYPYSWWLLVVGFIAGLTFIQRWKYRRHSVEQIAVGAMVGGTLAYSLCKII